MKPLEPTIGRSKRGYCWGCVQLLSLFSFLLLLPSGVISSEKTAPKEIILPMGAISEEEWLKAPRTAIQSREIDHIVNTALKNAGISPSPKISDEQFVRRVYLDLTGHLPVPADVTEFLANPNPNKRAKLIDRLLDSDEYAAHWGRYWREVITSKQVDPIALINAGNFEGWMADQLKKNVGWGKITQQILTTTGELRRDQKSTNGEAFFLLSRRGNDATTELAAETSRIFLGVQIQCAQCHDHPFDDWKRIQFHEFAAYLARVRSRPFRKNGKLAGIKLVSLRFGEHQMQDLNNPGKRTYIAPKFLDGTGPGRRLSDLQRRKSLADSITSKENPYFAAAFVNRMWGELMGQSFYKPIDDLGPQREAVMPKLITRLAGSFRGSDYDIKEFLRVVMNTDSYQRQIRLGKSTDQHLLFAANYPTRLRANAMWQSLEGVLGRLDNTRFYGRGNPYARFRGLEFQFLQEFNFDPSTKPEEVEGTISQALLLMNNPTLNQKIKATGTNLLGRILKAYPKDQKALEILYLRSLGRRPTQREMTRCVSYIQKVGNRAEAFEDILWVLINSTEFQTKR